ncbi:Esterase E4, partial [Gryllus bimaculatus]
MCSQDALPAQPWDGVRNATRQGCKCPQLVEETQTAEGCEDCLLLNVYTPKLPQSGSDPLPVMFWIHGGRFVWGSGNDDSYGPDYLISEGVVLVTINYRLSLAALRWVNLNIAAFNGDPNRITIFGESAGGSAVNWHMLSPMTR